MRAFANSKTSCTTAEKKNYGFNNFHRETFFADGKRIDNHTINCDNHHSTEDKSDFQRISIVLAF